MSIGTLIACKAGSGYAYATLFRCGITLESFGTVALAAMLGNTAERIWTTAGARLTRIETLVANTGLLLFALFVAATADGAVAFQTGQSAGTLAVIQTGDDANITNTTLPVGAVLSIATCHTALTIVA